MSTGSGSKPPSGSSPGRPAADTPQRIVVGGSDGGGDSMLGATDTAVAVAAANPSAPGRTSLTMIAELTSETSLPDLIGTTLAGRYKIERKIGQGGMGVVYEATHTGINKQVAVKVLLEKYAHREAITQRLEQEAKLAAQAKNEHIIDVNDIGQTDDGRTFVVMELLKGESLAECLVRETKLLEQRILRIASQAASALAAAHAEGIVHRDIKPENLFLLDRGKDKPEFVKVVDFGISKSLRSSDSGDEELPRLTQTGMVLGTPLYMSPEQARGDDTLDHRVDVYALGVIMYEAATGRVPFVGSNYLSVISQVLNEQPVPPRELRPELSEEFEAIVLRSMAKDREDRYESASKLLEDLNALLDDPTRSTERAKITGPRRKAQRKSGLKVVGWIAAVAVIVAAIAVTVAVTMGGSGQDKPAAVVDAGVVKPVAIDAAVVVAPIDAPATITFHVETEPAGATIARDGEELCTSPCDVDVVDRDRDVEIRASLDNYEDTVAKVNPLEHHADAKKQVHIKLKKAPKQVPGMPGVPHAGNGSGHAVHAGSGGGSAAVPGSRTGELQGYPIPPPTGSGK